MPDDPVPPGGAQPASPPSPPPLPDRGMLELLLGSTEQGVWVVDNEQRTTEANPAMCRMLGLSREQLLGRSIFEFVDADNAAIFREQVARRAQGQPGSYEVALLRSDGAVVHCHNNPTPVFDAEGRKLGTVGLLSDISASKRAAAELAHTSALLAAKTRVLESTLDALSQGVIHVSADGHIEAWNRRALELVQVPEQLLQQRPTLRAMVQWQLEQGLLTAGDPSLPGSWLADATRYAAGDGSVYWATPTYQRQRPDGRVIEVQLHRAPGGVQVRTYTDVTESAVARRALLASEARFRAMADAAPALIWQSDLTGRVQWFNQGWLRLIGLPAAQALSSDWATRIHPDDYPACLASFEQAAARREGWEIEFRVVDAGGQVRWISDHGIPLVDADGRVSGYTGYGWDITAHKAAQANLIAARDEAQRANRAKSEFLSRMSHELRTPLNAVLGFAQLIERDLLEPLGPVQRERVQQIRQGGAHLLQLINEVLDLARIEAGALPLQLQTVELGALLRDCLRLIEPMARQHEVTLQSPAAPARADWVEVDPTRLRQVLLNLLSNAIKYNRRGGQVQLTATLEAERLHLSITDTGPGLTAEQQQRLFQAFDRLGADRGTVEGTGIGLALSKALLDLMGGRIGVHSQPGAGSRFWIELPLRPTRPVPVVPPLPFGTPPSEPEPEPVGSTPAPIRSRRVLYIEDNPVNQVVVEGMLAQLAQVQLLLASEPEQGLAMAFAQPPDLVLLDIQLPHMNGYEVLRQLRLHPATRGVPVIAVSANAMPDDLARARAAGFDDYLTKPVELDSLLATVQARLPMH